jgi:hypothetical protein
LSGIVVIDDVYCGDATKDKKRGRGTEKFKVLVSISLNQHGATLFVKMKVEKNIKSETIIGTYHGLPDKYLAKYLDEFCYRFNRRFCEPLIFRKLLHSYVLAPKITCSKLTL